MAKPPSLESDAVKARETLDNALQGLAASNAALAGHSRGAARRGSINFPAEEALVEETLRLLERWKSQVATLLTGLDAATGDTTLAFARLFDETAGQPSSGSNRCRSRKSAGRRRRSRRHAQGIPPGAAQASQRV
jgi:hypothetical protein